VEVVMLKRSLLILLILGLFTSERSSVGAKTVVIRAACGPTFTSKPGAVNHIPASSLRQIALDGAANYAIAVEDAVYVTDRAKGTVVRILDGKIDHSWAVEGQPYGLAYSQEDKTVWIADFGDDSITKLDLGTDDTAPPFKVGSEPLSMAFDEMMGGMWVALYGENKVVRFTSDGTSDVTVKLPGQPSTVLRVNTCSGESYYLLVALGGTDAKPDHRLVIANPESGEIRKTISVGARPIDMVWDATNGLLYVANFGDRSISAVDIDAGIEVTRYPVPGAPLALGLVKSCLWVGLNTRSAVALNRGKLVNDVKLDGTPNALSALGTSGDVWIAVNETPNQGTLTIVPGTSLIGCDAADSNE
jgi:DNA-binding beta-propeller fold protein YncE